MEATVITKLCREVVSRGARPPPSSKIGGLQSGGRCRTRLRKIKLAARGRLASPLAGRPIATAACASRKARLACAAAAHSIEEGQRARPTAMVMVMAMTGKKAHSLTEVCAGLLHLTRQNGGQATTKGRAQRMRLLLAAMRM